MPRRTLLPLLLALLTAAGTVLAQPSFVDVPEGHWAGEAVERIAELGIVVGHPDGSYLGDDAFTRYQAALVVRRLLDVIDRNVGAAAAFADEGIAALRVAMARHEGELDDLEARVAALEGAEAGETGAVRVAELERRVEALDAEIARLSEALAEVRPTPGRAGPQGPERASGPQGAEGPRGPAGAPGRGDAARATEPGAAEAPDAVDGPGAGADAGAEPTVDPSSGRPSAEPAAAGAERRPVYLGLAAVSEWNGRVPVRLVLGYDELLGPLGVRATIDYGRQSPSDARAVTLAAHLTYPHRLGAGRVHGYAGAGAGVQLDVSGGGQAAEGAFAGGLLGLEVGLAGPTAVFVEGMVDYYLNEPPDGPDYPYGRVYPTVAAGVSVRF